VRIVDLTDEMGAYATKLLADLGADVIRLEPPEGSLIRDLPPFLVDDEGRRHSMFSWWMDTSKRSVAARIETPEGRRLLEDLVGAADAVVISGSPATLDARGLSFDRLAALNGRVVVTTVTPFGLTGELADYAADDLVLLAMGGLMYLAGYPAAPPTAVYGYQAYIAGSLFAAVGTLIALFAAAETGEGQLVDISIQDAVAHALENASQVYDLTGAVRERVGADQREAGYGLYPCRDGLVFLAIGLVGGQLDKAWDSMADWLEGHPGADIFREPHWRDGRYRATDAAKREFYGVFASFAVARSKHELYVQGQAHGLSICPVCTPQDLVSDEQLLARDFFVRVDHPELGASFLYPGAPYRLQRTPWQIIRRAPLVGEHTDEIRAELAAAREASG
jgi:crotonobetainyl-CoA:carnitine CoA-transferase CaiB-like acyl-CoA transferase